MPAPTQEQLEKYKAIESKEVLKYFVINGQNRMPAQLHMAIFKEGEKTRGHNLIPKELTDKIFCFDSLKDVEKYECPCGRKSCQYGLYLKAAANTLRYQLMAL
jgi:hypothetical protein